MKRIYDLNDNSSALAVEINGIRYVTDISNTTFASSSACPSGHVQRGDTVCGKCSFVFRE